MSDQHHALDNMVPSDPSELVSEAIAADYYPGANSMYAFRYTRNRPPFSYLSVVDMLTDPKILYGLWLLKGPLLANGGITVNSAYPEVQTFVEAQWKRFWSNGANTALSAIEWGLSASEVIYRRKDGRIEYDRLNPFKTVDVTVCSHNGARCGIKVRNVKHRGESKEVYIGGMKSFCHLHWRNHNKHYGLSRLFGCYVPYWETWTTGGYRDIRRLWFFKNCYSGGTMYHPNGSIRLPNGQLVSARDYARDIVEKMQTGGVMTLPSSPDANGNQQWLYTPPEANPIPEGLLPYGETLRTETLEGLGIPPEIVESGGDTGFGSATGRQIPQEAYFSILQELLDFLVQDFNEQVIQPLVVLAYGAPMAEAYELETVKINEQKRPGFAGNQFVDKDLKADGRDPNQEGDDLSGEESGNEKDDKKPFPPKS